MSDVWVQTGGGGLQLKSKDKRRLEKHEWSVRNSGNRWVDHDGSYDRNCNRHSVMFHAIQWLSSS